MNRAKSILKGQRKAIKKKQVATVRFAKQIAEEKDSDDDFLLDIDSDHQSDDDQDLDHQLTNDIQHSKLLTSINRLNQDKQKKTPPARLEAAQEIADHNLSASKLKVNLADLIEAADDPDGQLGKVIRLRNRKRVLDAPLERQEQDLIKRQAFYEQTKKRVGRWDTVVEAHRDAEQLVFPLNQPSLRLEPAEEVIKRYRSKNELETAVDQLLSSSKNQLTDSKPMTEAEERYLKAIDIEDARTRHKELQKMRALLSYQESKFKRQKKIKSKKYHRLLKKDRLKKEMAEFETLKKSDPELALEKLKELDKIRMLERASLRHKSTGKWAKHNLLRAKYDTNARDALNQQVELAKSLLKKHAIDSEDSEDEVQKDGDDKAEQSDDQATEPNDEDVPDLMDFNPWMKTQRQLLEEIIAENQARTEQNPGTFEPEKAPAKSSKPGQLQADPLESAQSENQDQPIESTGDENLPGPTQHKTDFDRPKQDKPSGPKEPDAKEPKSKELKDTYVNLKDLAADLDSDPEEDQEQLDRRQLVAEAFAEDDVVDEFAADKEETEEKDRPKDQCLYLPGWGEWAGPKIRENKKLKNKLTIKAKAKLRKDRNLGNVIINERASSTVAKFKVTDLPFPYKNVEQFENSVRHPIGSTFNPETAFRNLTEPALVTKMGTVIPPMNEESLPKKTSRKKMYKAGRRKE